MSEQDQNSPEFKRNSEEENTPEENRNNQDFSESGEAQSIGKSVPSPDEERESTPIESSVAHEEDEPDFRNTGEILRSEDRSEPEGNSGEIPAEGETHGAFDERTQMEEQPGEMNSADETSAANEDQPDNESASSGAAAEPAKSSLEGLEAIVESQDRSEDEEINVHEEVVDDLAHIIEAIIFASDEPLTTSTIKSVLDAAHTFGRVNPDMITARISALNAKYEADGNGFYIVEIANGYQYATRKELAQWVSNLFKERSKRRLSNSALETLAIIAYKQPITKPEIESIRGVNVDYILHSLLEKEIVTVVGRAETVGRPLLYGTTQKFLKIFTLKNLEDLPKLREIEEIIKEIKSRGAEESIQLEITALGESSEPVPDAGTKQDTPPENGKE